MRISDLSSDVCSSDLSASPNWVSMERIQNFMPPWGWLILNTFLRLSPTEESLAKIMIPFSRILRQRNPTDRNRLIITTHTILDRKSVVTGKRVSERGDPGMRSIIKKKNIKK